MKIAVGGNVGGVFMVTRSMIKIALRLAGLGLHVFPCRVQDKRPATANGVKDATTDPDMIELWWREEPEFNIAVVTGARSRIFVIDVDGLDAETELRKLDTQYGPLPATVESINTTRPAPIFSTSGPTRSQFRRQTRAGYRCSRRRRVCARAAK